MILREASPFCWSSFAKSAGRMVCAWLHSSDGEGAAAEFGGEPDESRKKASKKSKRNGRENLVIVEMIEASRRKSKVKTCDLTKSANVALASIERGSHLTN